MIFAYDIQANIPLKCSPIRLLDVEPNNYHQKSRIIYRLVSNS